MNPDTAWRPSAESGSLEQRAALLKAARAFFSAREVLEVETPVLSRYSVTDPHIESLQLKQQELWLRTSPEYHMKRLLADGSPDIYQIGKVFRAGETGSRHQPEFTMAEWYRLGISLTDMISETCEFIRQLHSTVGAELPAGFQTHRYCDLVLSCTGIDPLVATPADLRNAARALPDWNEALHRQLGSDRSGWLDFIVSHAIYPQLADGSLHVVTDHPAEQAMLARTRADNPQLAERFEVFLNGVELANGFRELDDANEQHRRFSADNENRTAAGLPVMEIDLLLLAALEHGLPDCCGVAVGLDRILMLAGGYRDLYDTLSFAPGF